MKTIGGLLFTTDLVAHCARSTKEKQEFHGIFKATTQNIVAMQDLTPMSATQNNIAMQDVTLWLLWSW